MLEKEFASWCQKLFLSTEAVKLIETIRTAPPSRRVRGRAGNVSGTYPSPKMGLTIHVTSSISCCSATTYAGSHKQVVAFLFSLMDLASACLNLVFVYSLASASDTFANDTTELQKLISASARQERVLSPSYFIVDSV
jgi:hypothetical protein